MNNDKFFSTFIVILALYGSSTLAYSASNSSKSSQYTSGALQVETKPANHASGKKELRKELRKEMKSNNQKKSGGFSIAQLEKVFNPIIKHVIGLKSMVIKPVSSVQDAFVMLVPFIFLYWLIVRKLE